MHFQEMINACNGTTKRRNRINVAVGTTIGVVLGAVAGILLAPKSGKETRQDIIAVAEIGVEKVGEVAHKAAGFVKKEAAAVKAKAKDLKTHVKQSKEIVDEAAEDIVEEFKTKT